MAREKPPEEPSGDVPVWFMTYSDVITLLMTFFILLLTFATNEPEQFERMQSSMFQMGGSTGIAGEDDGPLDKDAIVTRFRPRSSRATRRGSEMPPHSREHVTESINKGLEGLQEHQFDSTTGYTIEMSLEKLVRNREVSSVGRQRMRMLAPLLEGNTRILLGVNKEGVSAAMALIEELRDQGVTPGKLALSILDSTDDPKRDLKIELRHETN